MREPRRSLLAGIKEEIHALGDDAREMLSLRWQLARLEFQADAQAVKRLAVFAAVAIVMELCALPLLAVWGAEMLDGWLRISRAGWLLIFALGLVVGGAAVGGLARRRFRSRFSGMEQTREELREDLFWLGELTGKEQGGKH